MSILIPGTDITLSDDDTKAICVAASAVGGAIALPLIAGGGIGIAAAGTAFGISTEVLAVVGGISGATAANRLIPDNPDYLFVEDISSNKSEIDDLRNGDF